MDKKTLLEELRKKIASGEINQSEISSLVANKKGINVTKILYIIGSVIVLLGIIFFIAQVWNDIGSFGRIFVTLIFGFVLAAIGSLMFKSKPETKLGPVFYGIAGILSIIGVGVLIQEYNLAIHSLWISTGLFGVMFMFYTVISIIHRHSLITFFAILNATIFIYLLAFSAIESINYLYNDFMNYLTIIVGISFLLIAYNFRQNYNNPLVSPLNFLGSMFVLGASFSRVFESNFWLVLFFALTILGVVLSVQLRSRIILWTSILFLTFHLIYITSRYFADSVGWPISLVILGFVFIAIGQVSISISRKYISRVSINK